MKYKNMELLKECLYRYESVAFPLDFVRTVLIDVFEVNTLRYNHHAKGYLDQLVKSLVFAKLITYNPHNKVLSLNYEKLEIGEMIVEWKKKQDNKSKKEDQDV